MKNLLPFLSFILILSACKKNISNAPISTDSSPIFDSIEAGTFSVSKMKNESAAISPAPNTIYGLLGYGYDVNGRYADPGAARNQVVDIKKLETLAPGRVILRDATASGSPITIWAENAEFLSEQISNRLKLTNGLKVFRSSITPGIFDTTSFYSKHIYGLCTYLIQWRIIKFNLGTELAFKSILNPAFIADVENITPGELVKKYGTHILSDIRVGAKFEILYQAETKREDRKLAAKIGSTLGTNKVFGISNGHAFSGPDYANLNFSQKIYYKEVGGDSTKLPNLTSNNVVNPSIDITSWISTCTLDKATLIDIADNGLIPIYDLIEDPLKKAAVKSYIAQYLSVNKVQLKN